MLWLNCWFNIISSCSFQSSFFFLRQSDKIAVLLHLLREVVKPDDLTVVFMATKHHVEYVKEVSTHCTCTTQNTELNENNQAKLALLLVVMCLDRALKSSASVGSILRSWYTVHCTCICGAQLAHYYSCFSVTHGCIWTLENNKKELNNHNVWRKLFCLFFFSF